MYIQNFLQIKIKIEKCIHTSTRYNFPYLIRTIQVGKSEVSTGILALGRNKVGI